jgi:hypothetical protein
MWIAYWTYGSCFKMHVPALLTNTSGAGLAVQWYMRLIVRDLAHLESSALETIPANRRVVGEFIGSPALRFIDDVLAGIPDEDTYDDVDWDHDYIFGQFKTHIHAEQRRMKKTLDSLRFNIDQDNTLNVITGGGRPETVCKRRRLRSGLGSLAVANAASSMSCR